MLHDLPHHMGEGAFVPNLPVFDMNPPLGGGGGMAWDSPPHTGEYFFLLHSP